MSIMVNLIGERGGGKSTIAALICALVRSAFPNAIIASNIPLKVPNAIWRDNIVKWLAEDYLDDANDDTLVVIDEAAISGFESRGSAGIGSALQSYLLALSRKKNADIILISQMMSMVDKRGQWLSDYDILCTAHYETEASYSLQIPDYFEYSVYDANRKETAEYNLYGVQAMEFVFNLFDTNAVPNQEELLASLIQYFRITIKDMEDFYDSIQAKPARRKRSLAKVKQFLETITPVEELEELLGPVNLNKYGYVKVGDTEMYLLHEGEQIKNFKMHRDCFEKCGFHYVRTSDRPTRFPNLYWEKVKAE